MYYTDKLQNGLIDEYTKIFTDLKDKKLKILEIGIFKGGSLLWLADFFKEAKIVGTDIIIRPMEAHDRITLLECNQNDSAKLSQISDTHGPFDIVIDDGSHHHKETKNCFDTLISKVVPGGLYIIEDWIAGYWKHQEYNGINSLVFEIAEKKNDYMISDLLLILKEPKCSIACFKKV